MSQLKSWSGKGIWDAKEAKARRKRFLSNTSPAPGGSMFAYLDNSGRWCAELDHEGCKAQCIRQGTDTYKYFEGSTEEYCDGKPWTIVKL